jgi:hypothetical protein
MSIAEEGEFNSAARRCGYFLKEKYRTYEVID